MIASPSCRFQHVHVALQLRDLVEGEGPHAGHAVEHAEEGVFGGGDLALRLKLLDVGADLAEIVERVGAGVSHKNSAWVGDCA